MSHASNKVDWCLKKAEKEKIETGKHRGLIYKEPNIILAQEHLQKAEDNLQTAYTMREAGHSAWSASAFFYCLYHCCLAIAAKFGYESGNQECTIALLKMLSEQEKIELDSTFLDALDNNKQDEIAFSVIKKREEFQYGVKKEMDIEDFVKMESLAKEMLELTKMIIS